MSDPMPTTDAITRNLAMQIMIARGFLPPGPAAANYDFLMTLWNERYAAARVTAEQMLAAATAHDETETTR